MSLYKINIRSAGNGWTENVSTDGTVTEDGGKTCIRYNLDGDECSFTLYNGKAVQERIGVQRVKITFSEGEKTECSIGYGGFSGVYEIFTQRLKFVFGKGGYGVSLEYINGSSEEAVKLTFTAVKKGN